MASTERHGGPIDPFSPYDLHDVVNGDVPEPDWETGETPTTEYVGFHLMYLGGGEWQVQYDGHAGTVDKFHEDDYSDVLELVDDINNHVLRVNEFDYQNDKEALVEWAGKIMTSDKQKADENPDLYINIPEQMH